MMPHTGGIYVFLREGFGPCPAFVFGWTYMLIAKPAAAGGIATVFSTHFQALTGLHWNAPLLTCVALVAAHADQRARRARERAVRHRADRH